MIILFFALVIGIPLAIMIYSEQQGKKKRGCGRGCATCGNRDICHRRKKKSWRI